MNAIQQRFSFLLLLYADMVGLRGKARRWFGWIVIIASGIAFAAVALFQTNVCSSARRGSSRW